MTASQYAVACPDALLLQKQAKLEARNQEAKAGDHLSDIEECATANSLASHPTLGPDSFPASTNDPKGSKVELEIIEESGSVVTVSSISASGDA